MAIEVEGISYWDGSKKPHKRASRDKSPHSGVIDFGDLCRFAPYESGYCFIVVFNQPDIGINEQLQSLFVDGIERDFRGLSGLNDKSGESHDYGPSNAPVNMISKVEGMGNTTVTLTMTESTGTPITKYIGTYLDRIRNPYTQARTYNGKIGLGINGIDPYSAGLSREVFNMLYIITDSTCLLVEKAFYLLNAQPVNAAYSDLYNVSKGDISVREISVNFNCTVREGAAANRTAQSYIELLINHTKNNPNASGLVNLNSYEYGYSISGLNGKIDKINNLKFDSDTNELSFTKGKLIKDMTSVKKYIEYDPYGEDKDEETTHEMTQGVNGKTTSTGTETLDTSGAKNITNPKPTFTATPGKITGTFNPNATITDANGNIIENAYRPGFNPNVNNIGNKNTFIPY